MTVRAIEHIGLTVPDLEQATTFFAEAFGAEHVYDMIDEALSGPAIESGLGVPAGATIEAIRMLRLGNGPNLELFTYSGVPQRDPLVPSDYGLQHFCVYVDDMDAAAARLEKAGGTLLSAPGELPGGDAGPAEISVVAEIDAAQPTAANDYATQNETNFPTLLADLHRDFMRFDVIVGLDSLVTLLSARGRELRCSSSSPRSTSSICDRAS